ncbi:MAG: DUF5519 family protein [Steroidobacteraceae bacterium]
MLTAILVLIIIALGAAAYWARRDFCAWIALGKGGLPGNLRGWLTMTRFRLMKINPTDTSPLAGEIGGPADAAYLDRLLERNGPRPTIAPWPIPHRQCDQFMATGIRRKLDMLFDDAVSKNAALVHYKQSYFEKHSDAITLCHPECGHADARFGQGECAHIHPRDGSMHMIFSASDARKVLEAGWGEFHPLSGAIPLLPSTYLYVYPPRDEIELGVVGQLLDASIAHMAKSQAGQVAAG